MAGFSLRRTFYGFLMSAVCLTPAIATAGGITLSGTRVIYPAHQKQVSLSVRNTSDQSSFLVQSWAEQSDGQKSQDFVVTPPLYVSAPGNENTLRLMYVGQPVRTDRETLYYFNTKAIPSMDKNKMEGKNVLMLAAVTRVKLFLRPAGLTPAPDAAPAELTFSRKGKHVLINNPTPYYITLAHIKIGAGDVPDTMVPPHGHVSLPLESATGHTVTFRTINDYGAITPEQRKALQ